MPAIRGILTRAGLPRSSCLLHHQPDLQPGLRRHVDKRVGAEESDLPLEQGVEPRLGQAEQLGRGRVLELPEISRRLVDLGIETMPGTPEQMRTFVAAESAKWGRLVRELGMTMD